MKIFAVTMAAVAMMVGCGQENPNGGGGDSPVTKGAKFAYVMNQGDETINQYRIANDGSLVALSKAAVSVGQAPVAMVMDSKHRFVYVANMADNSISPFSIGTDGALSPLGAPVATGSQPLSIVISPDDAYVYVMNSLDDDVAQYSIGTDGQLTLISRTPNGDYPMNMAFSSDGKYAYVVNLQNTLSQYSVGINGALSPLAPFTVPTLSCSTGPIMSHRASGGGDFLYVLSCWDNKVDVFSIDGNGQLTALASVPTGLSPQGMSISGSHLYIANSGDGNISTFTIDSTGGLTPVLAPVNAGTSPETIALDIDRNAAYVIDFTEGAILQYSVKASGELIRTSASAVSTGASPMKILLK